MGLICLVRLYDYRCTALIMARRQNRLIFHAFALGVLLVLAMLAPACSTQKDSPPHVGTAEDYLHQSQNDIYGFGYSPYDLCTVYDAYCWTPHEPVYYYSRGDGDNDCKDGNCRDSVGRDKPSASSRRGSTHLGTVTPSTTVEAATHPFGSSRPAMNSAHFRGSFGAGASGGGRGRQ
jgi:hypothetical protein